MDKRQLAKNTADSKILEQLSHTRDWVVRYHVARNSNTSAETLEFLSRDKDCGVRYYVTQNSNTAFETLKQMAIDDEYDYVRTLILQNPNCPNELYMYIEGRFLLQTLSQSST